VSLIKLVEGLSRTKAEGTKRKRELSACLTAFELRHQFFFFFLPSNVELKHWLFLGLKPVGIQTETVSWALLGLQHC